MKKKGGNMKINSMDNSYRQSFKMMMPVMSQIQKVPEAAPAIIEKIEASALAPAKRFFYSSSVGIPLKSTFPIRHEAIVTDTRIKPVKKGTIKRLVELIIGKLKGPGRQNVDKRNLQI